MARQTSVVGAPVGATEGRSVGSPVTIVDGKAVGVKDGENDGIEAVGGAAFASMTPVGTERGAW